MVRGSEHHDSDQYQYDKKGNNVYILGESFPLLRSEKKVGKADDNIEREEEA